MVEDYQALRETFLNWKLSTNTMRNELAMTAWNAAIENPTKEKIWKFYVLTGMEYQDEIKWRDI